MKKTILSLCMVLGVCYGVAAVAQEAEAELEASTLTELSEIVMPEALCTESVNVDEVQLAVPVPKPPYPTCGYLDGRSCTSGGGHALCWSECAREPGICHCEGSPSVWVCIPDC